jgi:putative toxin-antitoxin system antitoxin component (TIGR02293 family)
MMGLERTLALLGGTNVLGRGVDSGLRLAEAVAAGLPSGALDAMLAHFAATTISKGRVYRVVGKTRTLQRKRRDHSDLSADESDRLARLARLAACAEDSLGSRESGARWLGKPNRALDGQAPIALLATDAGAVAVEQVLGRIVHGVPG